MQTVGATITYPPEGASSPEPTRAKIDLVAASVSHTTTEVVPLLRQRLKFLNLLLAIVFAVAVLGADTPFIASGRGWDSGFAWLLAAEHALVVVVSAALAYLLRHRDTLTLRQLRGLELVTLAPVILTLVTDQFHSLLTVPLLEAWALVRSTYAAGWSVYWLILIILYGTLIPNTWRRCAAVATTLALVPPALTLVAEACLGWPTPAVPLLMFLIVMAATLACAIPAIVYNVHRQEMLRDEAREARRLGQYRLGQRLGAGGMGEVYLAEHLLLRRACAIKLIRPEHAGDRRTLLRFAREVQATATLTHPNTIQVFDYGHTQDGTFYYVMEYLEGLTLDELVQKYGPLPPARTVCLLRQVCMALREAHAIGLIHRDIKPGNVMVCERGGMADVAKLLDFGLVRGRVPEVAALAEPGRADPEDPTLTQVGAISGTPAYMSPEQTAGQATLDARSDIYSVGALAYFLLTGQPPFAGRSTVQVLAAHRDEAPPLLTKHQPDVPADLQEVVLRCLAKDPAARFPDAPSLDTALAACTGVAAWTEQEAAQWWRSHAALAEKNGPVATGTVPS